MNQTANQLLGNIFNVLSKIEQKIPSNQKGVNTTSNVVGGVTKGGTNVFSTKSTTKDKASFGLSTLLMLPTINKFTKGFGANKDATAFLKFVDTLVKVNEKASEVSDKQAVSNLIGGIFNNGKDFEKNIRTFNKLEQSGALDVAVKGIGGLVKGLKKISSSISGSDMKVLSNMSTYIAKPMKDISSALIDFGKSILIFGGTFLLAGAILGFGSATGVFVGTLVGISVTLLAFAGTMALIGRFSDGTKQGMGVLRGISSGLIGFTASLVIMASSVLLLNAITGSPMSTAGAFIGGFIMVAGGIMVLAGAMGLIGSIAPLSEKGTQSLKGMGMGVLALSASLAVAGLLMYGASFLSLGEHTSTPIVIGLSVLAMAGMFGIIGAFSPVIKKGASTVMLMSLSILSFSATLAMSAFMFQKVFDTSKGWGDTVAGAVGILAVVGGIAGMALLYSTVIAPLSPMIALASVSVLLMTGSMLLMTYAMKKAVDATANVPDGFGSTLTTAIGGFIGGIWNGFKEGFGFRDGNLAVSALKGAAKVAALGVGSALLMGLSGSMIVFAKALSYFGSNGNIKLYDRNSNGEFIDGKTVDTVQAASSIGIAISSFLTEVSRASETINEAKMIKVTQVLLGSSSASFLGLKINPKPGLLDATMKFADMLNKFAGNKNTFRVYDDKAKKFQEVSVITVSKNIADSIMTFFSTIVNGVNKLDDSTNYEKVEQMAGILLGRSGMISFGWNGFKREQDKIGILEPVLKFAEIVKLLGAGKYKNDKGEEVDMNLDGGVIAQKIVSFSETLMAGLSEAEINDTALSSDGFAKFTSFIDTLGGKTDVIDKVASSIDKMADATSRLVESIGNLNESKLAALTGGKGSSVSQNQDTTTSSANSTSQVPSGNFVTRQHVTDNSDAVASKVIGALSARTFSFEFTNTNGGKLTLR